jgi:hypothetical protein
VERRFGVEHQLHLRRRRDLAVDGRSGRHDVLDQIAAVLGFVADGLPEAASGRQQDELAACALGGWRGRRRRSRRELADRRSAQEQRTGGGRSVGEGDQRVVHGRREPA